MTIRIIKLVKTKNICLETCILLFNDNYNKNWRCILKI